MNTFTKFTTLRVLPSILIIGCLGAGITGCSHSNDNKTMSDADFKKAFNKTAPPADYANWQKGTATASAPK